LHKNISGDFYFLIACIARINVRRKILNDVFGLSFIKLENNAVKALLFGNANSAKAIRDRFVFMLALNVSRRPGV